MSTIDHPAPDFTRLDTIASLSQDLQTCTTDDCENTTAHKILSELDLFADDCKKSYDTLFEHNKAYAATYSSLKFSLFNIVKADAQTLMASSDNNPRNADWRQEIQDEVSSAQGDAKTLVAISEADVDTGKDSTVVKTPKADDPEELSLDGGDPFTEDLQGEDSDDCITFSTRGLNEKEASHKIRDTVSSNQEAVCSRESGKEKSACLARVKAQVERSFLTCSDE